MLLNNPFLHLLLAPILGPAFLTFAEDTDASGGDDSEDEEEEEEDEEDADDILDELEDEDDEEEWDYERGMALINKLRDEVKTTSKENKRLEKQLQKYQDAEQDRIEGEKSELQKATERADTAEEEAATLKAELRDERIARAIEKEAVALGMDPDVAHPLVVAGEHAKSLKYDEETGEVSGHTKVLKKLAEEKEYLVSKDRKRTPTRDRDRNLTDTESLDDMPVEKALDIPSTL